MTFLRQKKMIGAQEFWSWFENNQARIEQVYQQPEVFDELMAQAKRYSPYIEFLIGKSNDTFELYVSCNGIPTGISFVRELVGAAPRLQGWHIIAFKQPLPIENFQTKELSTVTYADTYEVDAITATFALDKRGDKYNLIIYSPPYRMEDGHKFAYYLLLDMLIGEYAVMTKLGSIDMVPADSVKRPSLVELRDRLQAL